MRPVTLIEAGFHLGLEDVAAGAGPRRLLASGADRVLARDGMPAQVVHMRRAGEPADDLDAVVDLNRQIKQSVAASVEQDCLPVVLAGNCNTCLGTLAALDAAGLGIVWLDAHGDFHTPETSISGALEGMSLAIALGHCHADLRERIGMEALVAEQNTLLLGVRDLDPGEPDRLAQSFVAVRPHDRLDDLPDLLEDLRTRVDRIYLHIDIDFLDAQESPGVNYRGPGGVSISMAEVILGTILSWIPLAAVNLTNYNPALDRGQKTEHCALRLLRAIAQNA
ncbi:MAG: arginase family protein [Acidobacteriia bacterium]|nr:arginase family protein [Terriglobia bacterium]